MVYIYLGIVCPRKKRQSFSSQTHLKLRNMSKAEKFIQNYTKNCSNEYLTGSKPDGLGGHISRREFSPWLTPDQARRAVEIAREELIEKVIGWIEEINNNHHIIRYSDCCEPPISELTEWFKNYMKDGSKG